MPYTCPPLPQGFEGFAPPSGSGSLGVLVCAEACGEMEARYGRPLVESAPAGGMFERLIGKCGVSRDQLTLTNVVWSRPPRNWLEGAPWESEAVEAFRPLLDQVIADRRPRVILALGNVALRRFTAYGGDKTGVGAMRGAVLASDYGWVIPAYHPSFLVQGQQKLSGVWCRDFLRALEVAKDGFRREPPGRYLLYPTLQEAEAYFRDYNPDQHVLSYDIETPESSYLDEEKVEEAVVGSDEEVDDEPKEGKTWVEAPSYEIIRFSASYQAGTAITVPWQEPYVGLVKRVLQGNGPKRTWNGRIFDNPRLRANGCDIGGREYDLMFLWHHLQPSLPRGLQFVTSFYWPDFLPWKHTSASEPEFYSAVDADATQRCGDGIERDLRAQGMWDRAESHVVDILSVLDGISRNGMPVDDEWRKAFGADLKEKRMTKVDELQRAVPDDLKLSKFWKKQPHDMSGVIEVPPSTEIEARASLGHADKVEDPFLRRLVENAVNKVKETPYRYMRTEPFNPGSPKQVLGYMRAMKHPVGRNRKTGKPTTGGDVLKKLVKKGRRKDGSLKPEYVPYTLILECRKLTKVIGTYVEGWKPAKDGRVHPTGGIWGSMHRISWRKPNASATIADKDEEVIAAGFRKCVRAEPGHVLLEADWKGIESQLVAYFAGDDSYMRMSKIDVHSYFGSHFAGEGIDASLPDAEIKRLCEVFKRAYPKVRDDAKHCVHGLGYGMTWKLMSELYGIPAAKTKALIKLFFTLFPKIKQWQLRTIAQAANGKLVNAFQYPMWFWDIRRQHNADGTWTWAGEDVKSAISFLPRDTAAAMLKEVLLRIRELVDWKIVVNCTHDSILCHVPEHEVRATAFVLKAQMERPVPELGGLSVGVELKVGESWHPDEMEAYDVDQVRT